MFGLSKHQDRISNHRVICNFAFPSCYSIWQSIKLEFQFINSVLVRHPLNQK